MPSGRVRAIAARWRDAGYARTGVLGPGPAWVWLTPAGMSATGYPWPARAPALSRLAHVRGVLAARLWLQDSQLLAAQLPATDAEATAQRDHQAAALTTRIRKLDTAQNAQITALEDIPDGPAAAAMRARIRDRFAELRTQRTQAEAELAQLNAARPRAVDPALLDELPYLGDILPTLPPTLRARLFAALDLTILWNKTGEQATVTATITDATLAGLNNLLDPHQDGYHDTTSPDNLGPLTQHDLVVSLA